MKILLFYALLLLLILQKPVAYAQNNKVGIISDIINSVTTLANTKSQEKIYVQTDRAVYIPTDTIWFKAYLFNAAYLTASAKSGIAYIEIANDKNVVVKRTMVSMYIGLGWGSIALSEKDFPQGNYCLRAYTNWIRNYDENYIFKKQLVINKPGENDLLFNTRYSFNEQVGKQKATINLQVKTIAQQAKWAGSFDVKVKEGTKTWYSNDMETTADGLLGLNFDIPDKADPNKLTITLQALNKNGENPTYTIPVLLNRTENTDLQFMPESGAMVTGINSHIAFKALGEDGEGADVEGTVFDSKQKEVIQFKSSHGGMGFFNLHPEPGEIYTAKIKLPSGTYSKAYPLPPVKPTGAALSIINKLESDSLEITINATADFRAANPVLYLIGQSRGIGCYGAAVKWNNDIYRVKVNKATFPTGIAHFTLLNINKLPLNERIVYIDNKDNLHISLTSDKKIYGKRDSVCMDISVADKTGKAIQGSFSVAITDDAQGMDDSLKSSSLKIAVLLTSDLKGTVENPGYYFPRVLTSVIWQQLDNLLVAQGWINYSWQAVFQPGKEALYPAEAAFNITGKVTNAFNKPVEKTEVTLLSKKPVFTLDTVTDKAGIFNFTDIYPSDTAQYFIQTRNKNGKSFNVGIDLFEFTPPVFSPLTNRVIPWYVNIDSSNLKAVTHTLAYNTERGELMGGGKLLKDVNIIAKKIVKDSNNLNGPGESDIAMDQQDIEKAERVTLGVLLTKNFKLKIVTARGRSRYTIDDVQAFHLIIDGEDIADAYVPLEHTNTRNINEYFDFVKRYLDYYTTEDIKGIELMSSAKYIVKYGNRFFHIMNGLPPNLINHAWVEVTTYSGAGPFMRSVPGVFVYKPIPFSPRKEFYSPKYTANRDKIVVDTRATIYWAPNIITDKNGKANFTFFTADKPGTYTLLIEGCDMDGNIESMRRKIIVN